MGRIWKDGNWAVGLAFAIFTMLFAVMWFSYYWDFGDLCAVTENGAECFRAWFSASAGYLAVVAAGLTIFVLVDQSGEQKKQTAFLLGDAQPTMDAGIDLDDPEQVVVRIVNWNRRGVLLIMLDVSGLDEGAKWGLMETKVDGKVVEPGAPEAPTRHIRGWEDRSRTPHTLQFKFAASIGDKLISKWPSTTVIQAGIHIFDERPRRLTLKCQLFPDDLEFAGIDQQ